MNDQDSLALVPRRISDEIATQRWNVKMALRGLGGDIGTESEKLDMLQVALALATGGAIGSPEQGNDKKAKLATLYPKRRENAIAYLREIHGAVLRRCGHLTPYSTRNEPCEGCRPPHDDRHRHQETP